MFFIIFWIISQNFDQIITMCHSGYGDTPLGRCLSKNIHMLKSYLLDFQVCNKAASVWWTCPYNNNQMEHFTWKRRKCNVMKKKTISLIKYICHNKQLKTLHKFMPMNISQQIITFNIQKNSRFWHFLGFFFSIFELKILFFDICAYLILQPAVVFPA